MMSAIVEMKEEAGQWFFSRAAPRAAIRMPLPPVVRSALHGRMAAKLLAMAVAACLVLPSPTVAENLLSLQTDAGPAQCKNFRRQSDGAWKPLQDITIITLSPCAISVRSDRIVFRPGSIEFCGVDIGAALNEQCLRQ